jgi:small-conductance mechanosensitive channel
VPNTKLLNSEVVNFTKTAGPLGLIVHTTVGIGYDEDPAIIEELLIAAARETDGVKSKPGPFVLNSGLNAHDVSYEINAYCKKDYDPVRVRSALCRNVLDRFNEAGIQIMTPFYTGDPDEVKIPDGSARHRSDAQSGDVKG